MAQAQPETAAGPTGAAAECGICHVVSVSGGKDSTATALIALNRVPRDRLYFIFCDTGNEHEAVHEYLRYLEQALDIRIDRLTANFSREIAAKRMFIARDQRVGRDKNGRRRRWTNKAKRRALEVLYPTGNAFLDLCLWKGRFPSRKGQFCTEELKRNIAVAYQLDIIDAGHQVVSWQGVRRDESQNRRNAKKIERLNPKLWAFRPIVEWTATDVFRYCEDQGVQHNPLYRQGMSRVGCMPCVNVNKAELHQIGARFPEHIARIREWERLVSLACKRGYSTFLHKGPGENGQDTDRKTFAAANITQAIEWSKTTRGGRQFDLLAESMDSAECASSYGLCG